MISEFPLFVFTTLAGLAAGAYLTSAVFAVPVGEKGAVRRSWAFPLVCLALLGVGLLGCLGHLGRPMMFLNALANPSSMIAQEAYWSMAFGIVMLVDLVLCFTKGASPRALRIVGGIAGLGLMLVMGNAYYTGYGVEEWAALPTWPLYVVGDLAMGAAFWSVFASGLCRKPGFAITVAALAVLFAITAGVEVTLFAGLGLDAMLFGVAAVLSVVGAVVALVGMRGALPANVAAWATCALLVIAVAAARYCFYAASVL